MLFWVTTFGREISFAVPLASAAVMISSRRMSPPDCMRKDRPEVAAAGKFEISGRPAPVDTRGGGVRANGLLEPGTPVKTFPPRLPMRRPIWLPSSLENDLTADSSRPSISTCWAGVSRNRTRSSTLVNCDGISVTINALRLASMIMVPRGDSSRCSVVLTSAALV